MSSLLCTGNYQGANFNEYIHAFMQYNASFHISHRILHRRSRRISIVWNSGKNICEFRAYVMLLRQAKGIEIIKFEHHTCEEGSKRQRQIKSSVFTMSAPTINDFVPSRTRTSGNTSQKQHITQNQSGLSINTGQAHRIIKQKTEKIAEHLANY